MIRNAARPIYVTAPRSAPAGASGASAARSSAPGSTRKNDRLEWSPVRPPGRGKLAGGVRGGTAGDGRGAAPDAPAETGSRARGSHPDEFFQQEGQAADGISREEAYHDLRGHDRAEGAAER